MHKFNEFFSLGKGVISALLMLVLLASCAAPESGGIVSVNRNAGSALPDGLADAVRAYWEHRAAGDVEAAYGMETELLRERISVEQYGTYMNVFSLSRATSVSVTSGGCEADDGRCCCVLVAVLFSDGKEGDARYVKDCWRNVEGVWTHLQGNPIAFPGIASRCNVGGFVKPVSEMVKQE